MSNVGFIGVGYMGYGIAKNILDKAKKAGVEKVKSFDKLDNYLDKYISKGAKVHYLPQYRYDNIFFMENY